MKHDPSCELARNISQPSCRCAERAYLATASDDERAAWSRRRGYDTNAQTGWDLPPRTTP